MSARYIVHLYNHEGERIKEIDAYEKLDYALRVSDFGGMALVVSEALYPRSLFEIDYTFRVYRYPDTYTPSLEGQTAFLIRKVRQDKLGKIQVEAFSLTHLLARRVVAYSAGTDYASKSGPSDDVIKEIVRENLGFDAVDPLRRLHHYLTIAEDAGAGPTIEKSFSRRNVLEVLKDIAAASVQAGTWLGFDITLNDADNLFLFQTYTGLRGTDRRRTSSNPTLFPITALTDDSYQEDDYTEEVNYVYALGRGEEEAREVAEAWDLERLVASPFNRVEVSHQATQAETPTALQNEADSRLREGKPVFRFSGNLQQIANVEYGTDYQLGDLITFDFKGHQYDSRIAAIGVSATPIGDSIQTVLEGV